MRLIPVLLLVVGGCNAQSIVGVWDVTGTDILDDPYDCMTAFFGFPGEPFDYWDWEFSGGSKDLELMMVGDRTETVTTCVQSRSEVACEPLYIEDGIDGNYWTLSESYTVDILGPDSCVLGYERIDDCYEGPLCFPEHPDDPQRHTCSGSGEWTLQRL